MTVADHYGDMSLDLVALEINLVIVAESLDTALEFAINSRTPGSLGLINTDAVSPWPIGLEPAVTVIKLCLPR